MINLSWEEKELVLKGDGSILVVRNKRNVFLICQTNSFLILDVVALFYLFS